MYGVISVSQPYISSEKKRLSKKMISDFFLFTAYRFYSGKKNKHAFTLWDDFIGALIFCGGGTARLHSTQLISWTRNLYNFKANCSGVTKW